VIDVQRTDFVSVLTADKERSLRFYGETLGLRRNELAHEDWPEFETGNLTLSVVSIDQIGRSELTPSRSPIAFRVPDVAEARRKLEEAGVEFTGETFDSGVCNMAFFDDPDGNQLCIHHRYAPYPDGSTP
jgi:catechol 2,3-dioxygenase-like lactoylglutathione lyase family enzyme